MAAALYGTVIGSLLGGWPTDRFGRKPTLLWIGILYLVSAVWSGLATDVYSFIIARFIGGLGVGISTVAAPLFIAEISPPGHRGRLAGMFQFNIVFGILVAFLSNAILARVWGENAWRWMLGAEAFPALLYTLLCVRLPESPRWLISRAGNRLKGVEVLRIVRPGGTEAEILAEADSIISEIFPTRQRAEGQASGSFTHWIFAALLTKFFPKMVTAFPPGQVFWFFCGMMALQLIWIKIMVPETKGGPLEEMQKKLGIGCSTHRGRSGFPMPYDLGVPLMACWTTPPRGRPSHSHRDGGK